MSWLGMHLKDYKHVIQFFSLVKVTLSMMNPKICYYFNQFSTLSQYQLVLQTQS